MVRFLELTWDDDNVDHIARHGVEPHEVEQVVASERFYFARRRGRRHVVIGQAESGRYLFIVVDREWDNEFYVVTARTADADERRLYQRHTRRR
jgi:uncharacterized DUF497 family protein